VFTLFRIFGPRISASDTDTVVASASFQFTALAAEAEEEDNTPVQHHIPWLFSAYAEPDFESVRIASFNPQPVTIFEEYDNGWARIETTYGDAWVFLHDNKRYIERVTGLFESKPDNLPTENNSLEFDLPEIYPIDVINPQLVRVLAQEGDWLQIETWLGPMWIDLGFEPPRSSLDEFMARFGGSISVFYENLETGFIYTHNADRSFFGASMIKAPYSLWVYLLAEAGYTDLSTVHTYTSADHWGGSGRIQNMPAGSTFTEAELLRHALYISDNVAFRMLVRRIHGVNGFRDWVEETGGRPELVHTVTYSHMTANETGRFVREMHRYLESGGKHSEDFRQNLLDNRYAFIVSDHLVASKSGWDTNAQHDMAIVYSPSPYSLVIMTTGVDRRVFRDISMHFQHFNDRYFVGSAALDSVEN